MVLHKYLKYIYKLVVFIARAKAYMSKSKGYIEGSFLYRYIGFLKTVYFFSNFRSDQNNKQIIVVDVILIKFWNFPIISWVFKPCIRLFPPVSIWIYKCVVHYRLCLLLFVFRARWIYTATIWWDAIRHWGSLSIINGKHLI